MGNVAPGVYTITAIGSPEGDSATANFQVLPSPPSVPTSATVSVDIYIPPDFAGLTLSNTWTSFTNNYDPHFISVSRLSSSDQIGPNWWKISLSNITVTNSPSSYSAPLVGHRIFIANQAQYIRLFQVTSPSIAGRYFFKAFINGKSIGAENFPTIVVKASRDPAYISGVLRDSGEHNASLKGQPIQLTNGTGARVLATGLDYLGNAVSAQTFINSTALGSYTLFGVAPGTYNITAYAAGYIPATDSVRVSVGPAQSLEAVDIYLTEKCQDYWNSIIRKCGRLADPLGKRFRSQPFWRLKDTKSIDLGENSKSGRICCSFDSCTLRFRVDNGQSLNDFPFCDSTPSRV